MSTANRTKFAYLLENDIQKKLDEGVLDAYDVIFSKDTLKIFVITESLEIKNFGGIPLVELNQLFYSKDEIDDKMGSLKDPETGESLNVEEFVKQEDNIVFEKSKEYVMNALEIEII